MHTCVSCGKHFSGRSSLWYHRRVGCGVDRRTLADRLRLLSRPPGQQGGDFHGGNISSEGDGGEEGEDQSEEEEQEGGQVEGGPSTSGHGPGNGGNPNDDVVLGNDLAVGTGYGGNEAQCEVLPYVLDDFLRLESEEDVPMPDGDEYMDADDIEEGAVDEDIANIINEECHGNGNLDGDPGDNIPHPGNMYVLCLWTPVSMSCICCH